MGYKGLITTIPSTFPSIPNTLNILPLNLNIDGSRPLEKTYNCSNLGFRLTFARTCAGKLAIGVLILLSYVNYMLSTDINITEQHIPASFNRYLVINKCVPAVRFSNISGHYLRNRSTLDTGVLGYIGIL